MCFKFPLCNRQCFRCVFLNLPLRTSTQLIFQESGVVECVVCSFLVQLLVRECSMFIHLFACVVQENSRGGATKKLNSSQEVKHFGSSE